MKNDKVTRYTERKMSWHDRPNMIEIFYLNPSHSLGETKKSFVKTERLRKVESTFKFWSNRCRCCL